MKQKEHEPQVGSKRRPGAATPRRKTAPPTPRTERQVDESLDESFPASDPPAHSSVSHPPEEDLVERGED